MEQSSVAAGAVLEYRNKDRTRKPKTVFARAHACPMPGKSKDFRIFHWILPILKGKLTCYTNMIPQAVLQKVSWPRAPGSHDPEERLL